MKKAFCVCVLYFVLFPISSYAKIRAGSVESGLSFGWLLVDKEAGSDDKAFGRFDLGFNFTENIGAELSLANSLDSLEHIPDISFYSLALTLNMAADSDINPYLVLGAGVGNFNTDVINNESKFTVHGGGGIKFFFNDIWALKIDIRDYMTTDNSAHNFAGSIGLTASFDVLAPEAEFVPSIAEEPAIDKKEVLQEEELEKAKVTEPKTAVTEEETVTPEIVQESAKHLRHETVPGKEATIVEPEATATEAETVKPAIVQETTVLSAPETVPRKQEEGIVPETAVTEEEAVTPGVVQEVKEQPRREMAPSRETGIFKGLEEFPEDRIVILHKGAQLLVRFPYRSSDIDSELFNLLLQLLSYSSKKDIKTIKIVGYSYDYNELQAAEEINSKRELTIRDFILKHSNIQVSRINIIEQDEESYRKFKKLAEASRKDINRLYILISFN